MMLVALLQHHNYRIRPFLRQFWTTENFFTLAEGTNFRSSLPARLLAVLTYAVTALTYFTGAAMVWAWFDNSNLTGWWAYGLAVIVIAPLVAAHILVIPVWLSYLARPKYLGRRAISRILEMQVRALRKRHAFTVIGVVGSVGKTSTKAAIAKTLGASKKVLWQEGNYNVDVTVPLVLFSQPMPNIFNLFAWLKIWAQNARTIHRPYPYDVVILELGTDGPGQIEEFAYLDLDIVVVTAITPEHMEYFGTMDAVAQEELSALGFAKKALVNIDDTDSKYLEDKTFISYGLTPKATYYAGNRTDKNIHGQELTFYMGKDGHFRAELVVPGDPGAKAAVAAVAVAHLLGESAEDIARGVSSLEAFAGRQRIFKGIKQSTLIDDTYNASPVAVKAALDVLYSADAPQKIAILGTMNELGDYSAEAHREVGDYCQPAHLDCVVTIGQDAEQYLAPRARKQGCEVHSFNSPYAAGLFVKKRLKKNAVVLAKGSQNRVFAEESLKCLLANKADAAELVRQSNSWLAKKREQFSDYQ